MQTSLKCVVMVVAVLSLMIGSAWPLTEYDRIQIIINDHVITKNEIDIRLGEFIQQNGGQAYISPQQKEEIRTRMINLLIEEALLDIRADELRIQLSDDQLDAEVDQYRNQNRLSEIEFEELLERRNLTLADFKKGYLNRTRRNMVINQEVRSQIDISEEALKKLYESGAAKSVRVRARHILLILAGNASSEETEKVRKQILRIRNLIKSGKPFAEMADLYSQDPSVKQNHGDLGFFGKNDMVPEFANVAFSLEPGVLSGPVRTQFGFHLIEVIDKKEESSESFAAVRDKLYQQEYRKQFAKLYKDYIANLKKKARIIKQ